MADNILRRTQVEKRIGLSRSTLYVMIAEGTFPKPIRIGKRAVGWTESSLAAWVASKQADAA
ncbi:helix-turn-helix transcriptional regulator [Falsihalocynthiibacter arcticus]|uniref:DNA-binding protein n=1 Tax=Falsihalocynthiibacter arcticus TaxID=1579316 RepID=A0A126V1X7_9RHOB|nr:AlpA family phage regulatory protein [Falsihalocynthiibacter arcticus]AML51689.1 DNA-binding protein [Falsihalocynthiibacter arcticus]